ncbi:MAG TPA: hypothetical protein VG328_11420 [Stellaceae bacterium]|nr:hypothetical protein [Stellaceae bacterium]
MSYSLFLHFEPRIRRAEFLTYFARRRHYKAAKDRVSYTNEDTGVYFWIKPQYGRDLLLRQAVKSAEFEVNYNRPSFFGREAEKQLSGIVAALQPRIDDPQMEGMGEGPYSGDGFLRGWNFGNRFAIQQMVLKEADNKIATMPEADLHAAWDWNFRCAERRDYLKLRHYAPPVLFWRIDGRVQRVVVWGESMPIMLPRVEYVIVAREIGKARVSLVPWIEIVEIARRAGFDARKEPLELRYLTPPPLIVDWAANLPLIDLKAYERLPAHRILDEELVAAARKDDEPDDAPRGR